MSELHPPAATGVRLGEYELLHELGRGGMGVVWKARQEHTGAHVAIKVVTTKMAREAAYCDAFRFEVEAMAGLDHPGILTVFDFGTVPPEVDRQSRRVLAAGSPWFAMELASSTLNRAQIVTWSQLRSFLLQVLDALAHAHARGIVHRDLKPHNIVLVERVDGGHRYKLMDLGIAHTLDTWQLSDPHAAGVTMAGTPVYMSPEQYEGDYRDHGPWTDLYALGCVAFELVSSVPPYTGGNLAKLALSHLTDPIPPFGQFRRIDVPEGFEQWVQTCLAKLPANRFLRAADAAWALLQLEEVVVSIGEDLAAVAAEFDATFGGETTGPVVVDTPPESSGVADTVHAVVPGMPGLLKTTLELPEPSGELAAVLRDHKVTRPSGLAPLVPSTWQTTDRPTALAAEIGLGLHGLREIPFVGRRGERDRMWQELRRVSQSGRPATLVVRGAAGTGKSRIAQWLCRRAHEVGAATVWRAAHSPIPGRLHGLSAMLRSFFRCDGLSRTRVYDRVRHVINNFLPQQDNRVDAPAIVELIAPGDGEETDDVPPVLFGLAKERYAAIHNLARHCSRERAVLVWLDDVQWGADALWFVRHVMESAADDARVLLLCTVREEALQQNPLERQLLNELMLRRDVTELLLQPLASEEHDALVRKVLSLEPELAARVRQHAGGHPLFTIQMVGEWVDRGLLERGPAGFRLTEETETELLPANMEQLWRERIEAFVEGSDDPTSTETALMTAAALGLQVATHEHEVVCRHLGVTPGSMARDLARRRLAQRHRGHWEFAHGLLRETLEKRARRAGRWQAINLACARCVSELYPDARSVNTVERRALFLLEGGELADALGPLLEAARQHSMMGNLREAERLTDLARQAIESLTLAASDQRRGDVLWIDALNLFNRGELEGARKAATRLLEHAEAHGWPVLAARALRLRADDLRVMGDFDRAQADADRALALLTTLDDKRGLAHVLKCIGTIALDQGRLDEAEQRLEQGAAILDDLGDELRAVANRYRLNDIYVARGDLDAARRLAEVALEVTSRYGSREDYGIALNCHGEIARAVGDFDSARQWYDRASAVFATNGSWELYTVACNRLMLDIQMGRYDQALLDATRLATQFERMGWTTDLIYIAVYSLPGHATKSDLSGFDAAIAATDELMADIHSADRDFVIAATTAGDILARRGERQRALLAYELAQSQCWALGRDERARELARLCNQLQATS